MLSHRKVANEIDDNDDEDHDEDNHQPNEMDPRFLDEHEEDGAAAIILPPGGPWHEN